MRARRVIECEGAPCAQPELAAAVRRLGECLATLRPLRIVLQPRCDRMELFWL